MRNVTELYCLSDDINNFIAHMVLYNETTNSLILSQGKCLKEKSSFIFIKDKQERKIKLHSDIGLRADDCWNCGVELVNSYRRLGYSGNKWYLDKLRHDYPRAWGMSQAFLAGKHLWVCEFVEKYKLKPGHKSRLAVVNDLWENIGLYDISKYLYTFMGFEEEMDKWITNCIKLRYMLIMNAGIDPISITYYHPLVHFKNLKIPAGINFKTLTINTNKEKDTELYADTSIDYKDLFIEPKSEAIRELYKHLRNEETFDAKPNYIVSKFKSYHLISLGLLEDAKK